MILHEADKMPESPKPCGRTIKPETEHIAARHQGIAVITVATRLSMSIALIYSKCRTLCIIVCIHKFYLCFVTWLVCQVNIMLCGSR